MICNKLPETLTLYSHVILSMCHVIYAILSLCSRNWQRFIDWLLLLLEMLGDLCIVIICCPVFDVTSFEINHSFLFKPFFYRTKKLGQKCKSF